MHPFSLTEQEIQQVSGGLSVYSTTLGETGIVSHNSGEDGTTPFPLDPISVSSTEDGGWATTLAIGEEGGFPPDYYV